MKSIAIISLISAFSLHAAAAPVAQIAPVLDASYKPIAPVQPLTAEEIEAVRILSKRQLAPFPPYNAVSLRSDLNAEGLYLKRQVQPVPLSAEEIDGLRLLLADDPTYVQGKKIARQEPVLPVAVADGPTAVEEPPKFIQGKIIARQEPVLPVAVSDGPTFVKGKFARQEPVLPVLPVAVKDAAKKIARQLPVGQDDDPTFVQGKGKKISGLGSG